MHGKKIAFLAIAFVTLTFTENANSEIDEVQTLMLKQYEPLLRWDNVKSPPEWVDGAKPHYSLQSGMYKVKLKPGYSVKVRIPKDEYLRVFSPCALFKDDISLDVSDGSGLYARSQANISMDRHTLLSQPNFNKPQLVKISRSKNKKSAIEIALFISRHETLGEIVPYRGLIPFDRHSVQMSSNDNAGTQTYWLLEPGKTQYVKICGSARYAFENRLAYAETESRLLQTYQLYATVDGIPLQVIDFETSPENNYPIYVNCAQRMMGRLQTGYLDIPAGCHTLGLNVTAKMYGRLLQQRQPDYLFPKLNAPKCNVKNILPQINTMKSNLWHIRDNEIRQNIHNKALSPTEKEYTALRVVRDNSHREGGTLGVAMMKATAEKHRDYPAIQTVASELEEYHTFYRDIFPNHKQSGTDQYMAWFIPNRLHHLGEQGKGIVAGEQFLQELLNRIENGYFFDLPYLVSSRPSPEYVYYLPRGSAPSMLRVAVDTTRSSNREAFYVQLGDTEPILFHVQCHQELPHQEYVLTKASAGLEILAQLRGELLKGTLSGPFSQSRINAPLISANVIELPLPTGISEVKVWRASQNSGHLYVALQYRASKPFSLSETEYKEIVRQLKPYTTTYQMFRRLLKNHDIQLNRPEKELQNNWLPLRRFLAEEYKIFSSTVSPTSQDALPLSSTSTSEIRRQVKVARNATMEAQWLPALEAWSAIKRDGNVHYQREAQQEIIVSLLNLGEYYLAELQLRSILLYSKDYVLRAWAFKKILNLYRTNNDLDAIVRLTASMVMLHPGITEIQQLFRALLENNEYEFALMVGIIIPPQKQNIEGMLRAAYQVGWWATFNSLVNHLDCASDRAFWRAIQLLAHGKLDQAFIEFEAAGSRGVIWRNQIISGRKVLNAIISPNLNTRINSIYAWEHWQFAHPGPFMWQEDASLVRDSSGVDLLYSINRDMYSKAFKGTREKPVQLEIVGPVSVRLETRPLLSANSITPVDGWLRIREKNSLQIFPINNNTPSQGIKVFGEESYLAGTKVFSDFDLGPGLHNIQVDAGILPFLVRVLIYRPEITVPILPPLNVYTVNAAFYNQIKARLTTKLPCLFSSCLTVIPSNRCKHLFPYYAGDFPYVNMLCKEYSNKWLSSVLKNEMTNTSFLSLSSIQKSLTKQCPIYNKKIKDDIIKQMTQLVWIVEHNAGKRRWAIAQAENLVNAYPLISELQSLKDRMNRNTEWLSVINVDNSAGLRYIEEKGWQPETPSLRIRKALLSSGSIDERVLFGNDRLVYVLKNLRPTTVLMKLRAEDVSSLAPVPLTAIYQLDNGKAKKIILEPGQSERIIRIQVPKGDHALRIHISNPVANQFLRIHFAETRSAPPLTIVERVFFVATKNEPVTLPVAGPVFLRIDELRNGSLFTRYRLINAKHTRIQLKPEGNQTEALFRISQLISASEKAKVRPRIILIPNSKVPGPYTKLVQKKSSSPVLLKDGLNLGGQEDGTWSFSLSANRRKNFLQQNQNSNLTLEDFLEPGITYRYFSENRRTYFKTTILEHIRRYGGAVLGFKEMIYYQPIWYPINFRLNAMAFYQNPNGSKLIGLNNKGEWSATLVGAVSQVRHLSPTSYHIPELSVLIRDLSLHNTQQYNPRDVDQDIFTQYQSDHRKYFEIADLFYWRPWLDSLAYIGGSLASNPHFNLSNPDNVKLDTGWKQLIGEIAINPNFQYSRYFDLHLLRRSYGINLEWRKWIDSENLFEISINVSRGIDVPVTTGFIIFTWNTSNGRGYRDFRPGEIDFLDIRTREIPSQPNNYMEGEYHG